MKLTKRITENTEKLSRTQELKQNCNPTHELATRAKLKSVSKQFVDNLATHKQTQTHTLYDSRTHCKNTLFAAHWRHLLPA